MTLIQSEPDRNLKRRVSTPYGVTDAVEGEPFHILMANVSSHELTVPKGRVVPCATPTPSHRATPTPVLLRDVVGIDPPEDKGTLSDDTPPPSGYLRQLRLVWGAPHRVQPEIRRPAPPPGRTRERSSPGSVEDLDLSGIHRVEARVPPFQTASLPGRPNARDMKDAEVQRMLAEGVIRPSASKWASPVVLDLKPDG